LKLNCPVPTRIGYTFVSWNTAPNGSGTSYASGANYAGNVNTTLYAQWKVNTYTVKYDANGGTGAKPDQIKTHNVPLNLNGVSPTRVGHTFANWNTAANGSGKSYAFGANYTDNASVTLYAQWKANTYTVKYDANGGTGAPPSQTKTHDVTLTLSNAKPTRASYTLANWNTAANGGGKSYAPGTGYIDNASITLYAQWNQTGTIEGPSVNYDGKTYKSVVI